MKRLAAISALLLAVVTPAAAHRLDEYLQAAFISVEKDLVQVDLFFTPGTAVLPTVLAAMDPDGNGVISDAEQRAYAARVLGDLLVTLNGNRLLPKRVSAMFPSVADMKEGVGELHLELKMELPRSGPTRKLRWENVHLSGIAAYQVNCLVSRRPDIRIGAQHRNDSQSVYELDYTQDDRPGSPPAPQLQTSPP